jgi:hypothetical protein
MKGTDGVKVRRAVLEVSLRPFANDLRPEAMDAACREMFRQWRLLTKHAEEAAVMFWTADGSEILDYAGNLEDEFEWAKWVEFANKTKTRKPPYEYMENPPAMTYGKLKEIVALVKKVGKEETGIDVLVGETFDPGPEFAVSSFKYERHNEVCGGHTMGANSLVCCDGILDGDARNYAGFPAGIPDRTPFGIFFGRQCQHFLTDLGFDYIWFSNGFGYGAEPWRMTGRILKNGIFNPEKVTAIRKQNLDFWKLFRAECPDFPIETRGTNLTSGIDLASDGVSVRDIYRGGFNMRAPVNSPWTPINGFLGIEMAGWMSHIAELPPEGGFPYRLYVHDVWFKNDPWLDRYGREPYDIYLPLSIGRLNEQGEIETADSVNILMVDDSFGQMPEQVPNETCPHLLRALADKPDAPGPLVWAYPYDEYERRTYEQTGRIGEVFSGDWLICTAVNDGLPLNTVGSTRIIAEILKTNPGRLLGSVLVTPVPDADSEFEKLLLAHVKRGGKSLLYGNLHFVSKVLREMLGIELGESLTGEFELDVDEIDKTKNGSSSKLLRHDEIFSSGGWSEQARKSAKVFASGKQNGEERAAGTVYKNEKGGGIAWVRGIIAMERCEDNGEWGLRIPGADECFPPEALLRIALAELGFKFSYESYGVVKSMPIVGGYRLRAGLAVSRRDNGYFFSGYPYATIAAPAVRMRLPQGAPILEGLAAELVDGEARYAFSQTWHRECRVFVEQEAGEVFCNRRSPKGDRPVKNRLLVGGLESAKVRFYTETGAEEYLCIQHNPKEIGDGKDAPSCVNFEISEDATGRFVELENVTGALAIFW